MALSSVCRSCGAYFKIREGRAVSNNPEPADPFRKPPASAPRGPVRDPAAGSSPPPEPRAERPARSSAEGATRFKPRRKPAEPTKGPQREIDCLECDRPHRIPEVSTSTLCPHCGSYISLQNYEINDTWNSRIETRGDVLVGKKGRVHGVDIRCYDLTLKGSLEGGVDCSGRFLVAGAARLPGQLSCRELVVERRGSLTLHRPALAGDMQIDGTVEGDLHCEGRVELRKHARVRGTLTAGSLVMRPGARHDGQVRMTGGSLARRVSEALDGED